MVQGATSSAGKSLLVTALCRLYARRGLRVAPFKAQNMSNNAAVCADGGEIGRAQFTQAQAAGIVPTVQMNPILLKPEANARSQVIVLGRPWQTLAAKDYYTRKRELWQVVTTALDALRASYDLVIIEGAGSPVELNLKAGDIVNMAVARYAHSPVLLVGDIDRGGIFPQLLGTLWLLEPAEKALVKGLVVNKFRGDPALFADGVQILAERGGVPVLGVLPYLHDLAIPEEDAVAIEPQNLKQKAAGSLDIAIIRLPRIANFDDFDPLRQEVGVRYVDSVAALGTPDAVILPGTKSTIADLLWLQASGLAAAILELAVQGVAVVGICGGYQMLGQMVYDPQHVESEQESAAGLGLLPVQTTFGGDKSTHQVLARVIGGEGWLQTLQGQSISGYEIHMGRTWGADHWLEIPARGVLDGGQQGAVWGCYLHGVFANHNLRRAWLGSLGWGGAGNQFDLTAAFDRLADAVETALDLEGL